jgi:hypothetical protein
LSETITIDGKPETVEAKSAETLWATTSNGFGLSLGDLLSKPGQSPMPEKSTEKPVEPPDPGPLFSSLGDKTG